MLLIYFRLGQACNHIAALLFFIEHHAGDERLPTELSKTSRPMSWNQPPKKEVTPFHAQDMTFVKPDHSNLKDTEKIKLFRRRHPMHRTLQKDTVTKLISNVKDSLPNTAILGNQPS